MELATSLSATADGWSLTATVRNVSSSPALMIRLTAVREKSGDRILPALYSDNYISLMPLEERTISVEVLKADARGEMPRVEVDGFNVRPRTATKAINRR